MTTLSEQDIEARMAVALNVVHRAGELALAYFHDIPSLDIASKGPQDHVSQADRDTEALIKSALAEHFPQDAFVGEETGAQGVGPGTAVWVVDPIDGTTPFLLGLPTWCISVALVADDEVQIGIILNPATHELYAARRGHGATLNGRPLRVRTAHTLDEGLTAIGCSMRTRPQDLGTMMQRLLESKGMFHRIGSGALSLCYLAAGQLIGYVEMHINAWDCLAAICIVTEAGGQVSPFLATHGVTGGGPIVAASPELYPTVAALLP